MIKVGEVYTLGIGLLTINGFYPPDTQIKIIGMACNTEDDPDYNPLTLEFPDGYFQPFRYVADHLHPVEGSANHAAL